MRLARIGEPGQERPALVVGEQVYDLRSVTEDIDGAFLEADGLARAAAALDAGELPNIGASGDERWGCPIVRPHAVFCIGLNYAAHATESGAPAPTEPVVFLKTPNSIGAPDDDVALPDGSVKSDWEVELGVVIGRAAHRIASPEEAHRHIAGYVLADDLSEREFQLERPGGQWTKGKIFPGSTPVGPWLVTPDEVDVSALGLRSRVNGEERQNSSTADLIFSVPEIIHHLSQYARLEAGDLVLTGTPEGVALSGRFPYLVAGDEVVMEADGLGQQRHRIVAP